MMLDFGAESERQMDGGFLGEVIFRDGTGISMHRFQPKDQIWSIQSSSGEWITSGKKAKFWQVGDKRWIKLGKANVILEPYANPNREQAAEETGLIDYGCNFDKSGCCKTMRMDSKANSDPKRFGVGKLACCSECHRTGGYLSTIPAEAVTEVKSLWSDETGFWKEGMGCSLPRKWRSRICLTYNCASGKKADELYHQLHKAFRDDASYDKD